MSISTTYDNFKYEAKLYIDSIGPTLRDWYHQCQKPSELQKRVTAAIPSTIPQIAAYILFPKAAIIGTLATVVAPEAVDRVMHATIIQAIDDRITGAKKTALAAGILLTAFFDVTSIIAIPSSFFIGKFMADMTLNNYYKRKDT